MFIYAAYFDDEGELTTLKLWLNLSWAECSPVRIKTVKVRNQSLLMLKRFWILNFHNKFKKKCDFKGLDWHEQFRHSINEKFISTTKRGRAFYGFGVFHALQQAFEREFKAGQN